WTRIDFGEQFALLNKLAFLEGDIDKLAVHAAANRDGIQGSDCAEAVEVDRQIAGLSTGDNNWNREIPCTACAATFSASSSARGCGCILRFMRAVIPKASGEDGNDDDPDPCAGAGARSSPSACSGAAASFRQV